MQRYIGAEVERWRGLEEQVQWCRAGAEVQSYRYAEVQRCRCRNWRCSAAEVQCCSAAEVQRCRGAEVKRRSELTLGCG